MRLRNMSDTELYMFRNAYFLIVFAILSPTSLAAQTVPPTRNPSPVKNSPSLSAQRPTARTAQPSTSNQANPAPGVQSSVSAIHKFSPTTGWVSDGSHLLLTNDNGADWADISPSAQDGDSYAGVFFTDADHGFVWIAHSEYSENWSFSLARTSNAGGSWTEAALPARDFDPSIGEPGLSSTGSISFSDAQHGWISLDVQGNTVFAWSTLLSTADGGSTWTWVETGPDGHIDGINAVTTNDIWITTNHGAELDVSHNGGATFQPLSLANPANTSPVDTIYELPYFSGSLNGYEVVSFKATDNSQSEAALFVTSDGGQSWHQDRLLTNLDLGTDIPTVVVSSTWIILFAAQGSTPAIVELSASGTTAAPTNQVGDVTRCNISFDTPSDGWISCPNGLSTTSDIGSTWVDITPSDMKAGDPTTQPQAAAASPRARTSGTNARTPAIIGNPSGTPVPSFTTLVSERLAFDTNHVPTPNMMQKWWDYSPYYAIGIYLPGGPSNNTYGAVLNPQWVTKVAAQGWGFIPIWSGPQAPCACRYGGTYPSCKTRPGHTSSFPNTFDWDPTIAESEGESQAEAAYNSALSLGLDGKSIYVDVERYELGLKNVTNSNQSCSAATQAYVNGWTSRLHELAGSGSAGVYGSMWIWSDIAGADNAYMPRGDNRVTVWNLGHDLPQPAQVPDTQWGYKQRIHQYITDVDETWDGVKLHIDSDLVDAPVIGGEWY